MHLKIKTPTLLSLALGSALCLSFYPAGSFAQTQSTADKPKKELKFSGSKIEGEREKPKDLYIVPWQGTTLLQDSSLGLEGFENLDEARVADRYTFSKEMNYYRKTGAKPR